MLVKLLCSLTTIRSSMTFVNCFLLLSFIPSWKELSERRATKLDNWILSDVRFLSQHKSSAKLYFSLMRINVSEYSPSVADVSVYYWRHRCIVVESPSQQYWLCNVEKHKFCCGKIWSSHNGRYEKFFPTVYNVVDSAETQQTFLMSMSPPPSGLKGKPRNKSARSR
jgi:hypothetical protein